MHDCKQFATASMVAAWLMGILGWSEQVQETWIILPHGGYMNKGGPGKSVIGQELHPFSPFPSSTSHLLKRFLNFPLGCCLFGGRSITNGYLRLRYQGLRRKGKRKMVPSIRISFWEIQGTTQVQSRQKGIDSGARRQRQLLISVILSSTPRASRKWSGLESHRNVPGPFLDRG